MRFARKGPDGQGAQPLVRCDACGFEWFGATAAHGLSVLGSCSRCGGELRFRDESLPDDAAARAPDAREEALQPWQVLGPPTSWSGH